MTLRLLNACTLHTHCTHTHTYTHTQTHTHCRHTCMHTADPPLLWGLEAGEFGVKASPLPLWIEPWKRVQCHMEECIHLGLPLSTVYRQASVYYAVTRVFLKMIACNSKIDKNLHLHNCGYSIASYSDWSFSMASID